MSATATMPAQNELASVVPPEMGPVGDMASAPAEKGLEKRPPGAAVICMILMLLCNLAAPFWGIVADRGLLQRKTILAMGCLGEAMAVTVLALVQSFLPMIFLRAMSGFFLASLRPVCSALVADMTSESHRGRVFGCIASGLLMGIFSITLVAGNVANLWIYDLPGWRLVMALASLVAYFVAAVVWRFMIEPPRDFEAASKSIASELWTLLRFLRIPTFSVMILQGIFGNIPYTVMGNKLLFFKLSGLPDWQATILSCEGTVVASFGVLLGGWVGDSFTKCLGLSGRPLTAQITTAVGIPLMYLEFWGIPVGEGTFLQYFPVIAAFGLLGSWAIAGSILPILSHIIPSGERSKVMAWECALESSLAAAVGPASVSILADCLFGYKFEDAENGKSIVAATALGKAMVVSMCFPWILSILFYSLMYWSYPRDVRRLETEHPKKWEDDASAI